MPSVAQSKNISMRGMLPQGRRGAAQEFARIRKHVRRYAELTGRVFPWAGRLPFLAPASVSCIRRAYTVGLSPAERATLRHIQKRGATNARLLQPARIFL